MKSLLLLSIVASVAAVVPLTAQVVEFPSKEPTLTRKEARRLQVAIAFAATAPAVKEKPQHLQ